MVKKSCCCSNFFSCVPCFSKEQIPSSASCASSDALPSSANPTTEAEAGVKHHDCQTSNASNSYYAADSASAEGASSSSAAATAASAIPDVVKQDDPRPVESPSTDTSSSAIQTLDIIHKDVNAFQGENLDVDLGRLIDHISHLLEVIKENGKISSKRAYQFWPIKSERVNKVKDFLSEAKDFVKEIIPGDTKNIVRGLLQAMGTAHLATTGLLVVSNVLERFEEISNNQEECLCLLKEMIYLAKIVNQIKERPQLEQGVHDEVKDATEMILEGSIMCCSQMGSSKFYRLFSTTVNKQELVSFTQRLDVIMYKHIPLKMSIEIYDANQCKTGNVSRLYPTNAVGIEEAAGEVIDILEWGSEQNAVAVILHGLGGMGKTTLAQAVFSKLEIKGCKYSKVELFENINSSPKILELQEKILKDLMGTEKIPEISNYVDGQLELERTLEKVPSFIYVDNVLDADALRKLLPPDMNKAKKVRLLITARDLNVRKACPMKAAPKVYAMRAMSSTDAKNLLQKVMFDDPERILDSKQFNHMVEKCGRIPLMLNLVAGALRVAKDKPQEVLGVMEQLENLKGEDFGPDKIEPYFFAYDKLPRDCKDPFLDICSYFHGWDWDTVANIVGENELEMLESRALVTKDTNGVASVHDIILELGRQKSEGVRFRLTSANEAKELLDNIEEKDIQAIKGIWLLENNNPLDISPSKLDLMYNSLRVLAFESLTQVKGECSKIFKELIFFKAKITHLPFRVSKLKRLKYLNYTPKDLNLSEMPSSLRHVEFDGTLDVRAFQISSSDLQHLENLRTLILINFAQLKNLPKDMGNLVKGLRELSLSGCRSIKELPESISKLGSLRILRLEGCNNLTELPVDFGTLSSLQELHLRSSSLKGLPDSVEKLSSLKLLDLYECYKLLNLPPGLGNLTGLVKLHLNDCIDLEGIPESIKELKLLQPTLNMSRCTNLKKLPNGFCNLSYITHLSLAKSYILEKLPDGFGELASLKSLDLEYCERLEKLPKGFGRLKCLEELILKKCSHLRELSNDFHELLSLRNLDLSFCLKLKKLPADFHYLVSLEHLYLSFCDKLEGKIWMDHLVKMKRLQIVHIKESKELVKRWEEIQGGGHQSWSFVVNAGQVLSEDQKENIEKKLLSDFDRLLTNGRGQSTGLPPNTLFLVVCCDIHQSGIRYYTPWRLIEEMVDDIQIQLQIIYIGPHFSKLPMKVQDRALVRNTSVTGARKVLEQVYLTLGAYEDIDHGDGPCCFQMHTKMVGDGKSDKYLPPWQLLTWTETEELLLGNCGRYLRLKQLVESPRESNMKLLRELFTPEGKENAQVFQTYQSEQDRSESSEPSATCGVDKLEGKNVLLEMRPAHLCYDIRLSSLKEMYHTEKKRLDLEIISIPIPESDRFDVDEQFSKEVKSDAVHEQFSKEVPWLILQKPWTVITRAVIFFLVKQCGWEAENESEKCHMSIFWMIESNGRITTYKPSLYCQMEKWEVLFNHLESVSYQVTWGTQVRWREIEELRKEEWKQLNSMSTLEFIFNHLESVSVQVREIMFQGKMICLLYNNNKAKHANCILNLMMDVRDSIHIIYIPGRLRTFNLTDTIERECYHPWGKTIEMEGMSLLNLSGNEAVRFWTRLLHLKEDINGMDNTDKQFCEMRRFLQSFPLVQRAGGGDSCGSMIFMCEDGKMVAACSHKTLLYDFLCNEKREDRAKRVMKLLIKVSMEGRQTHIHDYVQTAAPSIDQEIVDSSLDSLSKYTSNLLAHEELYQRWEFNKDGERSTSRRSSRHQWPTSIGFSMLKNFLSEGINASWVKEIISRHPQEDKWKTVTKSLLKEIREEDWAAAGLLVVADVLERFETVSANRNDCLYILDEMNRLAIYLKQSNERFGPLWTAVKREAAGSIVIGSIICCAHDPLKFAMFIEDPIDLFSFKGEIMEKTNIMAVAITDSIGSESGSVLEKMCDYMMDFIIGDLESENENEGGPSAEDESGPSAL